MKLFYYICNICILTLFTTWSYAQPLSQKQGFSMQDTLRGSIGSGRSWWNVTHYNISVKPDIENKTISGYNDISFDITSEPSKQMQIDLQQPMQIVKIENLLNQKQKLSFTREGNVYWVDAPTTSNKKGKIRIYFSGTPKEAINPPWDGGWIWKKDSLNRPFISVACQGLGASVWLPCKDHQSDEPENGMTMTIIAPKGMSGIGNGRLAAKKTNTDGTTSWTWKVVNPINSYNIIPSIAYYKNFTETINGEKGRLDASYWVLDYNLAKAKQHFKVVQPMMKSFERWMGPYPFYEDSYKLIESPHLGMEHQSGVAYGNKYLNGYLGRDISGTGWGQNWDFIIIHETGHEWFGNNITTKDIADMWVHEGFTVYTEAMFVEDSYGLQAVNEYIQGKAKQLMNDQPITGTYGVNHEGSGDMYNKGAAMIHTLRQLMQDDAKFKKMFREMGKQFYHQTVTGKQVEDFISNYTGLNLQQFFNQYLRSKTVPVIEFTKTENGYLYKWTNCIEGFDMKLQLADGSWLHPGTQAQTLSYKGKEQPAINKNFCVTVKYL